jgi:hypothetical protein
MELFSFKPCVIFQKWKKKKNPKTQKNPKNIMCISFHYMKNNASINTNRNVTAY